MLKTRVLTALVLLPLMLAALFFFSAPLWAAFSWLVVGLALWEYSRMVSMAGTGQWLYLAISTLLAAGAWFGRLTAMPWLHLLALAFWLAVVPLWLSRRWVVRNGWGARLLGWLLMFPAWFALLEWRPQPNVAQAQQLLAIMGLVWVADIAAYFSGKAFGRRKLAPSISPGKSWEGVYGALVATAAYVFLVNELGWLHLGLSPWSLLLLSLPLTAVSIAGDLLESWFKRAAGFKDSSQLLPGHGGVYDRIDSLIAVLAVSNALRALSGL